MGRDARAQGEARPGPDARLGFQVAPLTPQLAQQLGIQAREGTVVTNVVPYSSVAAAAIRPGQLLLRINDQEVKNPANAARIAGQLKPGQVGSVRVRHPQVGETIVNYRLEE
jgi:S1-C subfamily serine protease